MTSARPDWLDKAAAQAAAGLLEQAGFQALFVGGCVRNSLLNEPVTDLDLSTDATPDRVLAIAQDAQIKAVPTGIDHGTVTLVVDGDPVEVTTFRHDVETDGRHARVRFSRDVAEDAARRDFTMNAIYMDLRGDVVDPLDGMDDLRARRVRFVGDASRRVAEDYLRILRFFRFTAWYGAPTLGIDPEGLSACAAGVDGLAGISRERIGAEMMKLLAAPDPAPAVAAMAQSGVLMQVLPGADPKALAPLVHLEDGSAPEPAARLAVLTSQDMQTAWRLSAATSAHHAALAEAARGMTPATALGYRLGEQDAISALRIRSALLEQSPIPQDLNAASLGAKAVFPLKAADLMPALNGPALGRALRRLEQIWIESGFALDRDALLERLDQDDD